MATRNMDDMIHIRSAQVGDKMILKFHLEKSWLSMISAADSKENNLNRLFPPPCPCLPCLDPSASEVLQESIGLRHTHTVTDEDATALLGQLIQEINRDMTFLKASIHKYGNAIINQWTKKIKRAKRAAYIKDAFPNMFPCQIFEAFNTIPYSEHMRDAYLLPYLNIQDLTTDPRKLLNLLYYRTAYPPDAWVMFDKERTGVAWRKAMVKTPYSIRCVVMYGHRYGALTNSDNVQLHRHDILWFPRALLILDAQKTLMAFLHKIVESILTKTVCENHSNPSAWPQSAQFGLREEGNPAYWAPYSNRAFSRPPAFNLDRIRDIIKIRLAAAEDNLWMLQTDPAYFRLKIQRTLNECTLGPFKYNAKCVSENVVYLNGRLIYESLVRCHQWQMLESECDYMYKLYQQFRDNVHPGRAYPTKLGRAILCFYTRLGAVLNHESLELLKHVASSPGFRAHYDAATIPTRQDAVRLEFSFLRRGCKRHETQSWRDACTCWKQDKLHFCLMEIYGNIQPGCSDFDHADVFDFLDSYLDSAPPEETARISQSMYEILSELTALHEISATIRDMRPSLPPVKLLNGEEVPLDRIAWRWAAEEGKPNTTYRIRTDGFRERLSHFVEIPVPSGKRDAAWLKASDDIRRVLSDFWREAAKGMRGFYSPSMFPWLRKEDTDAVIKLLQFGESPKHLANIEAERKEILNAASSRRAQPNEAYQVPSQPEWQVEKESALVLPQPKAKTKSRPAKSSDEDCSDSLTLAELTVDNDETPAEPNPSPPRIAVKASSLAILRQLFPSPSSGTTPGIVRWPQFVAAMADAGFAATHIGGSGVSFTPVDGKGSICFHKPHPDSKIDPIMMYSHGKRLNKWFGWCRESFVERPKAVVRENGESAVGVGAHGAVGGALEVGL